MKESKKVLCGNCVFYGDIGNCSHHSNISFSFDPIYWSLSSVIDICRNLNKNGNCKNYKRLWYKFWVK